MVGGYINEGFRKVFYYRNQGVGENSENLHAAWRSYWFDYWWYCTWQYNKIEIPNISINIYIDIVREVWIWI